MTGHVKSREDLVQYQKSLDCVHCGMCLSACPTYALFGRETTNPRGRVYLLRGLAEGAIAATAPVVRDLDLCLVCRACEPVCPSGVRFAELMEFGRSVLLEPARPATATDRVRRFAVRHLLPWPRRVAFAAAVLALGDALGLRRLLRRIGLLRAISPELELRDRLLPPLPCRAERAPLPERTAARGEKRGTVALLEGCVMPQLLGRVNRATARLLSEQGFDVVVPRARTCCGALSAHFGALDAARAAARRTIVAFAAAGPVDAVVVNSAGCGCLMKEYGRLLAEDPGATAAERAAAEAFAARVQDVSEFLDRAGARVGPHPVDARVAYADACHLAHGQHVTREPRALLAAIPGLVPVALADPDRCCGAAGLYNALHPAESLQLLDAKLDALERCGAGVLAVGNPGCLLQWQVGIAGRGLGVEVVHPAELLLRTFTGPERQR